MEIEMKSDVRCRGKPALRSTLPGIAGEEQ
jgi:hypothetical protein